MTRVAVSILCHDSAGSTIACVHSLLAAGQAAGESVQLEVYVSDNASNTSDQNLLDGALAGQHGVHLQINRDNPGFAAGHNRNLALILSEKPPDFVWILNSDCLVGEGALLALVECAWEKPETGIWGATLLEPDGETIQCAGGCLYNAWISSYRQYARGETLARLERIEPADYDYIAGASLFFPVSTLREGLAPVPAPAFEGLGDRPQWLNESYFLYFEELDLAKRLRPGLGMGWCRHALITHAGGASTGAGNRQRSELAEYHSTLSALKFTRSYYPRRFWATAAARYLSKCLQLALGGNIGLTGVVSRAYRDYFRGS